MSTRTRRGARTALASLAAFAGCRIFSPIPDMRTPVDHAHEVEPKCTGLSGPAVLETIPPSAIESVEPAYSYVHSGPMDPQARLRGARIHVRPLPGLSRESLTRSVECHEVDVTLGRAPMTDDDPYVLPDRWLDIDVDSEGDGFVVSVRIDELPDAKQVLARAKRFAARR
jgi:hypothetical protein